MAVRIELRIGQTEFRPNIQHYRTCRFSAIIDDRGIVNIIYARATIALFRQTNRKVKFNFHYA